MFKKTIYIKEDVKPIIDAIAAFKDNGNDEIMIHSHLPLAINEHRIVTLAFIPGSEPFTFDLPDEAQIANFEFNDKQNRAGTGIVHLFDGNLFCSNRVVEITINKKPHFNDAVKYKNSHSELQRPFICDFTFSFTEPGNYFFGINGSYFTVE